MVRAGVSYMTLEFVDSSGSTVLYTRVLYPRDHQMYLAGGKGMEHDQGESVTTNVFDVNF